MAASLARRTGTVGALVAAAGVTMVAGAWPALAAAPLDPRPAEVQGVGGGLDTAPGQAADEPAAVEASPLAEQPVEQPVEPVAAEPLAEPVVEEPAVRSPRGRSSLAPGRERIAAQAPVDEPATGPVAEPVAEPVDQPAAAGPIVGPPTGVGKGRDKKAPAPDSGRPAPRTEPAAPAAPAAEAPAAAQGKGSGVLAERRSRAAAAAPPAAPAAAPAVGPVARPRSSAPVVGPVAPAALPDRVAGPAPVMGPQVPRAARPSALATAGSRSGRAQVAAADAVPLRPSGAEPIALPDVVAQPRPLPVDLGTALPTVAAQTVGAVARTPEWPLGIVGVVLVFLLVQNRIDRRDPKLSHAHVEDEAPLDFEPLSGRPQLRLVTAA